MDDKLIPGGIRWDNLTIEAEALHLPADCRELYYWFKSWARDACLRDPDLVLERVQAAGFAWDRRTCSRILRGRWNRTPKGDHEITPVIPLAELTEALTVLRRHVREVDQTGWPGFVETSITRSFFDYCDLKRRPGRVNRFGVVIGSTGSQRTAAGKEYARRRNHGQTKLFDAPFGGSVGDLLTRMAYDLSPQTSSDKKLAHLRKALRPEHQFLVDNCQDCYRDDLGGRQPAFSLMRSLQDETGCSFIWIFTTAFAKKIEQQMAEGYFEQFAGRTGGTKNWLRLPKDTPRGDVLKIAEAHGLQDAAQHLDALVKISREPGRIRRLFEDLQDGRALAGDAPFTFRHIREARGEE